MAAGKVEIRREDYEWSTDDWLTPTWVLSPIREFFGGMISLDPASNERSLVGAENSFTKEDNGLNRSWHVNAGTGRITHAFCNPPYSKPNLELFTRKAADEYNLRKPEIEIVLLIPVYSSTKWWQKYVAGQYVCFLNKRVSFLGPDGKTGGSPTFHSCLVYYGFRSDEFKAFFTHRLGYVAI